LALVKDFSKRIAAIVVDVIVEDNVFLITVMPKCIIIPQVKENVVDIPF
jgi:hypothetical protein